MPELRNLPNPTFEAPVNDINNDDNLTPEEKISNIQQGVLDELKDVAASNKLPMWIRPVNKIALSHMKKGAAGKTMFIHGKSSPEGTITQGLICMSSSISKAGMDDDVAKVAQYNDENKHSVEVSDKQFANIEKRLQLTVAARNKNNDPPLEGAALFAAANVTDEELAPLLQEINLVDNKGRQIYIFENDKALALRDKGKQYVYAVKSGDQFQRIDLDHKNMVAPFTPPDGYNAVEIKVLGKLIVNAEKDGSLSIGKTPRPYTADIDLLGVASQNIDLNRYDQVIENQRYAQNEKKKAIDDSGLKFSDDQIKALLSTNTLINIEGFDTDKITELSDKLKKIDKLRENYKSIGHGTDDFIALVGHMRSVFAESTELSHGAEQFNIDFTQPLDKEWVLIRENGEVSKIKGEEALLASFNEHVSKGYSVPPNPFWGWQWNKDRTGYEIDPKRINTDALRTSRSSVPNEQKVMIDDILNAQRAFGIANISGKSSIAKYEATSTQIDPAEIEKLRKDFETKLLKYEEQYGKASISTEKNPLIQGKGNDVQRYTIESTIKKHIQNIRDRLQAGGLLKNSLKSQHPSTLAPNNTPTNKRNNSKVTSR